jgi:hypothetical protein
LYKEFTKLAVSLFKILNKETIYEIKNKLVHKVEKKFWWNPLEDEIAFSDGNYNALNFTTNR